VSERRRRIAGLLAITVAAAASAATSPPPLPSPAVSRDSSGEISLTAEAPVASVIVTVSANATLRGAGGRTSVTVSGAAQPLPSGAQAPVIAWFRDLDDGAPDAPIRPSPNGLTAYVMLDCVEPGDCERQYRITAALVDPNVEATTFTWQVHAETRLGSGASGASEPPAPTGSRLEIRADSVDPVDPATVAGMSTPAETVELGPDAPVAIRDLIVSLTNGGGHPDLAGGAVLSTVIEAIENVYQPPIVARLVDSERHGGGLDDRPVSGDMLFADCPIEEPCERRVRLELLWQGGDLEGEASASWSVNAWTAVASGPAPAVSVEQTRAVTVDAGTPRIAASATGSVDVAAGRQAYRRVTVALDQTAVDQQASPYRAWVVLRLHATADERSAGAIRVGFQPGISSIDVQPGATLDLVSPAVPLTCGGRSDCSTALDFGTTIQDGRGAIDWEIDAEVIYTEPIEPPPGATVALEVTERE
jgi:hypothetical protein